MLIRYWSSDVCSSDLSTRGPRGGSGCGSARTMSARRDRIMARIIASGLLFVALLAFTLFAFTQQRAKRIAAQPGWALTAIEDVDIPPATAASSDERRVGKECDSTCRTR